MTILALKHIPVSVLQNIGVGVFGCVWLAVVGCLSLLCGGRWLCGAISHDCNVRPDLKTLSGGEFDWGGTSVKS